MNHYVNFLHNLNTPYRLLHHPSYILSLVNLDHNFLVISPEHANHGSKKVAYK